MSGGLDGRGRIVFLLFRGRFAFVFCFGVRRRGT